MKKSITSFTFYRFDSTHHSSGSANRIYLESEF
jgi:hypothetical protein